LSAEITQGEPIRVGQQELIPFVRVANRVRRSAFLGDDKVAGSGLAFVDLRPVALLRQGENGEQYILIRDETAATVRQLLVMAVLIACAGVALTQLGRIVRSRPR